MTDGELSTAKKRILVIDDDLSLLTLNKAILEMDGYEVTTARGGEDALGVLKNSRLPNLILLDMQMELMSGPEFLLKLESTRPEIIKSIPVVFLTAMDQVPLTKASGFIRKPMDLDAFLESVQRHIQAGVAPMTVET